MPYTIHTFISQKVNTCISYSILPFFLYISIHSFNTQLIYSFDTRSNPLHSIYLPYIRFNLQFISSFNISFFHSIYIQYLHTFRVQSIHSCYIQPGNAFKQYDVNSFIQCSAHIHSLNFIYLYSHNNVHLIKSIFIFAKK